jgi:serine phosphatase RsbU (regulator of sigma subunit)
LQKYNDAILNYNEALKIQKETGSRKNMPATYCNMAVSYHDMGKLSLSIESIEKAIKIAEEVGNKKYLANVYYNLGVLLAEAKKYDYSSFAFLKALKYSKEIGYRNFTVEVYQNLAAFYEEQKEFKKAFEYAQLYNMLIDSIYNESNSRQANELTSNFESEKKELVINNLEKDKALSAEKLESEKNFKIYLMIFGLFIAVFAFVLYRGNIQKRKANIALSFAYKEIEEKNKDISDSINYSKRIQDASLAPKELRNRIFPDAFILFKPKDIVSGDFYWFAEKDGKRLIAACDCTGHGVPGALMSMIGNNILNQVVNEKNITVPDEILNLLHIEIRKALKQEENNKSQDGMDIALITFNNETEIEYTGAQRPLWIIKNGGVAVTELKAEKFSVGGYQSETERKFTKHKLSLSKGDCIYIFSDGYADQFGGLEEKRFMSKRFKELLLSNYTKPMPEQEKILIQTLETWRGIHEQVDDVLVIGIKI